MRLRLLIASLVIATFSLSALPALAAGTLPSRDSRGAVVTDGPRIVGHTTPRALSSADRARYAQRESASPAAKRYRGGDAVIYISATAAVIIVAVILLIILL